MQDALIPVGILLFIGLFVYAVISAGRKQRATKRRAFRELARRKGLAYRESDDGQARRFARDLDGIGVFRSPSLGEIIPEDVVTGIVDSREVMLFRHRRRFYEGYSREWFVACLRADSSIAERCAVQFLPPKGSRDSMYLADPIVADTDIGPCHAVVRSPTREAAGEVLGEKVLRRLGSLAEPLQWRPEIQVRGRRLAVYPAGRNDDVDSVKALEALLEYARSAVEVLGAT